MEGMRAGEGVPEEGLVPGIGGLDMIILDMTVRWGVDLAMLMKDLMVGMLDGHLVAMVLLTGIQDAVVLVMLPALGLCKEKG